MITYRCSQKGKRKMGRRRATTQRLILEYLASHPGAGRAELARHLELTNTGHFHAILRDMVGAGLINEVVNEDLYPTQYDYFLTDQAAAEVGDNG